jgi:hypothetical protein
MAIEALYPSRRYPQRNNPLFRRERRRHRWIVATALVFCVLSMAVFRMTPTEASAAARPGSRAHIAALTAKPARHVRVIPLYNIPPEQANGLMAYQD